MIARPDPKALEPLRTLDGLLRLEGETTVSASPPSPEGDFTYTFRAQPQVPFKPNLLLLFGWPGRPGSIDRVSITPYDHQAPRGQQLQGPSRALPLEPRDRKDAPVPDNVCEAISLERFDKRTLGIGDVFSIDLRLEPGCRPHSLFPVLLGQALDYLDDSPRSFRSPLGFTPYPHHGATAVIPIELPRPSRVRLVTLEPESGASPLDLHLLNLTIGRNTGFLSADPLPFALFAPRPKTYLFPGEGLQFETEASRPGDRLQLAVLNRSREPRRFSYRIYLEPSE